MQPSSHEPVMRELIAYAKEKMDNGAYPFAAAITKNGVVIARGYNQRVIMYGDITTHGEMEAISRAVFGQFYGTRNILGQEYALYTTCEPCLACFDTVLWSDIRTIVWSVGNDDFPDYFHDHPYSIADYQKDNPDDVTVSPHVLQKEGKKLFLAAKKKYGW